jgi:DNA-binding MarR family transcriptional regulator
MARDFDRDPILAAYHLWIENGWEDCADGLAAVTSIIRVRQVLTQRADQILAPIGLTFSRYEVLVHLYFNDGELPLAQLGKRLQIHQTSITGLVDKLEARDLIRRTRHPTDRRSTIARMTPAGQQLVTEAITRLNADLFRDIGLSGDEVQVLFTVLTKMRRSWGDLDVTSPAPAWKAEPEGGASGEAMGAAPRGFYVG